MPTMQETNRALALKWFEDIWNGHRIETADEIASPDLSGHLEGSGTIDLDQFKAFHSAMVSAIPNLRVDVEGTVAEGDHVVVRWRMHGTHTADGLGFKALGHPLDVPGITWFTFREGKLVGGGDGWNQGALFQALQTPTKGD